MIVFLDTNVYIAKQYQVNDFDMKGLRELVKAGKVTGLLTSITKGEVFEHLEKDIPEAVRSYNKTLKKQLAAFCGKESYSPLNLLDPKEAVNFLKENLNAFWNGKGMTEIPLNPIDVEELMSDYFNIVPPFEPEKRKEFKDAIMIKAIKRYQKDVQKKICIISNDGGFRKAFEESRDFIILKTVGEFLKYYNDKQSEKDCIFYSLADGNINHEAEKYLENLGVYDWRYELYECNEMTVKQVSAELLYIEEEAEKKYAVVLITADIEVEVNYLDSENSYYDKEENDYIITEYVHAIENHQIQLGVRCECEFTHFTSRETILNRMTIEKGKNDIIELNDNTMISHFEVGRNNTEYCYQCGKNLTHEDFFTDFKGNLLCRKCMKTDNEGAVCPNCGRKFPHENMMSGMCQECANR